MTESERTIAAALNRCTFCPGIGTKRFAREMAYTADHSPNFELTPNQRKYLLEAAVKFRRQIPADVVALAEVELAAGGVAA